MKIKDQGTNLNTVHSLKSASDYCLLLQLLTWKTSIRFSSLVGTMRRKFGGRREEPFFISLMDSVVFRTNCKQSTGNALEVYCYTHDRRQIVTKLENQ